MRVLGFAKTWIRLVMECVSTVKFHVQFEGDLLGPVFPGWGLRQGDLPSLYLFIFVLKVFHRRSKIEKKEG